MYYPYLRGKLHELAALRATAPQMAKSGKIVPVVEPVSEDPARLERAATDVLQAGIPFVLITNPQVGDLVGGADVLSLPPVDALLKHTNLIPGFIVTTGTTAAEVHAFSNRYAKRPVCFVHLETPIAQLLPPVNSHPLATTHIFAHTLATSYATNLKGTLVRLSDNFNRMERNASYPPDEFYSDDHLTFKGKKLAAFSDFSIVGDFFSDAGGAAHAVAIHLHHAQPAGLWIRHFLSDRVTGTADVAGKFGEAVAKLDAFAALNPNVAATAACAEFRQHHTNGHFPGLGTVKQLSIRHHIETLAAIL